MYFHPLFIAYICFRMWGMKRVADKCNLDISVHLLILLILNNFFFKEKKYYVLFNLFVIEAYAQANEAMIS